jgi:predicted enzyme related to lactoylglutathione lyase
MAGTETAPGFFGPILLARDFALTVSFYRTVIGLPVEGVSPYAECVSKPSTFSIADARWWATVNGPENPTQGETSVSNVVLTIQVPDLEEVFERMVVTGARFLSAPTARPALGVRNAFLRDPDGRAVMLSAPQ